MVSWVAGLGIGAGALVLAALGGLLGWRALMHCFVRRYYAEWYQPLELQAAGLGRFPDEHHLSDVPWMSTAERVCQSTSLQMIAAQKGMNFPRRHFDFLMGFTYGASQIPRSLGFYPGTDPEPGFVVAAPYLGLVRRFLVTQDASLYVHALRYYLSQGYPVRVALDVAVLYDDLDGPIPHSNVLVGYDPAGFYYYETVCLPEVPCEPDQRPPGEAGLYLAEERLQEAVLGQARLFDYPWRYALSIFEPGPETRELGPVWARNGQSLIGGARHGPCQGADVMDRLADEIEKRGIGADALEMEPGLIAAVYVRRENACYLREQFPGELDLEEAASLFDQASARYRAVLESLQAGAGDGAAASHQASWLREAAEAERAAGEIFVERGRRPGQPG